MTRSERNEWFAFVLIVVGAACSAMLGLVASASMILGVAALMVTLYSAAAWLLWSLAYWAEVASVPVNFRVCLVIGTGIWILVGLLRGAITIRIK